MNKDPISALEKILEHYFIKKTNLSSGEFSHFEKLQLNSKQIQDYLTQQKFNKKTIKHFETFLQDDWEATDNNIFDFFHDNQHHYFNISTTIPRNEFANPSFDYLVDFKRCSQHDNNNNTIILNNLNITREKILKAKISRLARKNFYGFELLCLEIIQNTLPKPKRDNLNISPRSNEYQIDFQGTIKKIYYSGQVKGLKQNKTIPTNYLSSFIDETKRKQKEEKCKDYRGYFITSSKFSNSDNFTNLKLEEIGKIDFMDINDLCRELLKQNSNKFLKKIHNQNFNLSLIFEKPWNDLEQQERP